jgi:hypothetical protein
MSKTPNYDRVITELADAVIERAQREIGATRTIRGKRRRRVTTGALQKNLNYTQTGDGLKGVTLEFGAKAPSDAYVGVIDKGRKKGAKQPPPKAIAEWMRLKPVRIQKKGGGFIKETPALKKQVAFLIGRAIARDGIEGIEFYDAAITATIEEFQGRIEKAIADDAALIFDAKFKRLK